VVQGLRTAGFAEKVTVHESQVVPIAKHLPLDVACIVGCGVVTGAGAVLNTAGVEPGSSVAVIGAGGVGLNVVQGAVVAGASDVVAIDVLAAKLAAARTFGATCTADARSGEVEAVVTTVTAGRGFDYGFVAAGSVPAVEQGLGLVAKGGTVVILGMPEGMRASFDPEAIADRGVRVLGSKVGSVRPQVDIPALLGLYEQGRLKLDELVTHRFALDAVNEAFTAAASGEALRAVVQL
jgi:Zn-dependent alcohol dehydrogenase